MKKSAQQSKVKGIWSPYVLAAITILLSSYAALILFSINFGRFAQPRKRTCWLILTPIIYTVLYALDYISPDWVTQRGLLFNIITIWIMYSQQIGLYQRWKLDKKPMATIWLAVRIALGVIVLIAGIEYAAWYLLP